MLMNVTKWGNSLGLRIPRVIADKIGIHEGTSVDISIENHHIVIKKGYSLGSLLDQITSENIHEETLTGDVRGKEFW
jgi:antitoxin MazE